MSSILTLRDRQRTSWDLLDDSRRCLTGGKAWVSSIQTLGDGERTCLNCLDDSRFSPVIPGGLFDLSDSWWFSSDVEVFPR